jgi:hypothetical protein
MQPHKVRQENKPRVPDVTTCVNPNCDRKFLRLGEGSLCVFPISDPAGWGLPAHVKQKSVWICEDCSRSYFVRLDRRHHTVILVHRWVKSHAA